MAGLATLDAITNPDKMFADAGVNLIISKATQADARSKTVTLHDGKEIQYDKLLLATGARPAIPPIEGHDTAGVFTLRSAPDAVEIRNYLESKKPKKMVLIGAGFTNLEVAALLTEALPGELDVTVVEIMDHPLPLMLDAEMAGQLQESLTEKGFTMKVGRKVEKILSKNGSVSGVELDSGERIDAEIILLSVGVRQNLELAQSLGLETNKFGIKVNAFLETSDPDVMAAGDCVEKRHYITKKAVLGQLRGPAVIQGRLAAKRLAGYDIEFPGVLNNSVVRLFDKYIASVGLTEKAARDEGFETITSTVGSRSKHGMIPGVKPWTLKLVFNREDHKLLGGQILSDGDAPVKEIDTINALILGGKTLFDLTTLMCAGNPDCSSEPSLEPISICGEQALQKLGK